MKFNDHQKDYKIAEHDELIGEIKRLSLILAPKTLRARARSIESKLLSDVQERYEKCQSDKSLSMWQH